MLDFFREIQGESGDIQDFLAAKAARKPCMSPEPFYLKESAPEWLERLTVRRGQRVERRFWQPGGGYDRNVFEPHTLLAMIEYIRANPVTRGLVKRAEDWKWSSAGWREEKNLLQPDPLAFGGLCLFLGGKG
jgi:putative transposase